MSVPLPSITGGAAGPSQSGDSGGSGINVGFNVPAYPFSPDPTSGASFQIGSTTSLILAGAVVALMVLLNRRK
jgi:hypothetical protein